MSVHRLALVLTLVAGAVAGCGGSDSDSSEENVTPAQAVAEIERIRMLLDDAVDDYRAGDRETAEETVGDAYLEHFEQVEGPLGERDHELMEELEEAISTELRNDMKAGEPVAEVEAFVAEIERELDQAVEALQGS
jgi:high-affinity iron transporter